jgi:hypothetical protein
METCPPPLLLGILGKKIADHGLALSQPVGDAGSRILLTQPIQQANRQEI